MKNSLFIFLFILAVSCATIKPYDKQIKSIKGYQDNINVSVELFDEYNRIVFEKTSQIIDNWDGELLTWITANVYEGNRKTHEYYAHSNHILRETVFDYYPNGELQGEYYRTYNGAIGVRNEFGAIHSFTSQDSLINYIEHKIPDSIKFRSTSESYLEYFNTYTDSSGLIVKEYLTLEMDSSLIEKEIRKYDGKGNLVFHRTDSPTNSDIIEYKYNRSGKIEEEIERYDLVEDRIQRKVYLYKDNNYIKELFYHGENLAFIYEYFYQDSLLIKKVTNRITDAAGFKNRPRKEIIEYVYEFFYQ
ncbi:MAG: hypothetical protein ACMZ7B_03830 [Balneola sp.]